MPQWSLHDVNVTVFPRQPAGYCFVEFSDPNAARMAMLRLNSKTIPNSVPVSSNSAGKFNLSASEFNKLVAGKFSSLLMIEKFLKVMLLVLNK